MNINLDVYDIASEDEVKRAVLDSIKDSVGYHFKDEQNFNRLITNISYEVVLRIVNDQFDKNLENLLKDKVIEVINGLSSYTVFRRKDAWEKDESIAYKILEEECKNSRPLIKQRVEKIIDEYPFNELRDDEIGDVVYQCVMDRLFRRDRL